MINVFLGVLLLSQGWLDVFPETGNGSESLADTGSWQEFMNSGRYEDALPLLLDRLEHAPGSHELVSAVVVALFGKGAFEASCVFGRMYPFIAARKGGSGEHDRMDCPYCAVVQGRCRSITPSGEGPKRGSPLQGNEFARAVLSWVATGSDAALRSLRKAHPGLGPLLDTFLSWRKLHPNTCAPLSGQ